MFQRDLVKALRQNVLLRQGAHGASHCPQWAPKYVFLEVNLAKLYLCVCMESREMIMIFGFKKCFCLNTSCMEKFWSNLWSLIIFFLLQTFPSFCYFVFSSCPRFVPWLLLYSFSLLFSSFHRISPFLFHHVCPQTGLGPFLPSQWILHASTISFDICSFH